MLSYYYIIYTIWIERPRKNEKK